MTFSDLGYTEDTRFRGVAIFVRPPIPGSTSQVQIEIDLDDQLVSCYDQDNNRLPMSYDEVIATANFLERG